VLSGPRATGLNVAQRFQGHLSLVPVGRHHPNNLTVLPVHLHKGARQQQSSGPPRPLAVTLYLGQLTEPVGVDEDDLVVAPLDLLPAQRGCRRQACDLALGVPASRRRDPARVDGGCVLLVERAALIVKQLQCLVVRAAVTPADLPVRLLQRGGIVLRLVSGGFRAQRAGFRPRRVLLHLRQFCRQPVGLCPVRQNGPCLRYLRHRRVQRSAGALKFWPATVHRFLAFREGGGQVRDRSARDGQQSGRVAVRVGVEAGQPGVQRFQLLLAAVHGAQFLGRLAPLRFYLRQLGADHQGQADIGVVGYHLQVRGPDPDDVPGCERAFLQGLVQRVVHGDVGAGHQQYPLAGQA